MHIKEFRERKMALIVRRCLRKSAHAAVAVALFTAVFAAAPQFSSCASDKAVENVYLGTPAHVWWETDTTGKWSSVSKAHEYQVKLYIADSVDRDEDNWRKVDFDDEGMEEAECVMTKRTGKPPAISAPTWMTFTPTSSWCGPLRRSASRPTSKPVPGWDHRMQITVQHR